MTQLQRFKTNSKLNKNYMIASIVSSVMLLSFVIYMFIFKPDDIVKGTSSGTLPYLFMFLAGLYAVNNSDYLLTRLYVIIKSIMALGTVVPTLLAFTQIVNGISIVTLLILGLNLVVTVVMTTWVIIIMIKMKQQRKLLIE